MAISKNIIMQGVSGTIDKLIVFRNYNGKTVISKYPDMSERKLSTKQKRENKRMKKANAYAKEIFDNDAKRDAAQLRLDVPKKQLYRRLIKEYYEQTRS